MNHTKLQGVMSEMDNLAGMLSARTENLQDISHLLSVLLVDMVTAEQKGEATHIYTRTDQIRRLRTLSDFLKYVMQEVVPAHERHVDLVSEAFDLVQQNKEGE